MLPSTPTKRIKTNACKIATYLSLAESGLPSRSKLETSFQQSEWPIASSSNDWALGSIAFSYMFKQDPIQRNKGVLKR